MNWNGIEVPDNPYFQDEDSLIYCANCRDILPLRRESKENEKTTNFN